MYKLKFNQFDKGMKSSIMLRNFIKIKYTSFFLDRMSDRRMDRHCSTLYLRQIQILKVHYKAFITQIGEIINHIKKIWDGHFMEKKRNM